MAKLTFIQGKTFRGSSILAGLAAIVLAFSAVSPAKAQVLWEGEVAQEAAGFPFITRLLIVDPAAPLVVFSPGRGATARVAYGGHEGSTDSDFLAYWLNQGGYNFLGVSYPVFTQSGAFEQEHPDFTIPAWGRGTAELTKKIREENGLTGAVIHAGWSMAGKSVQPFAEAAKEMGLEQDFFVSLAATPPIPGILNMNSDVKMDEATGLAALRPGAPNFAKTLERKAKSLGRTVIPTESLVTEYLGHTPIQLQARGLRYDAANNAFVRDHWAEMQESKFFDLGGFPLVAMIIPTQKGDARHVMTDEASWGFYLTNKMYRLGGPFKKYRSMDGGKFEALAALTRGAPERLAIDVEGNHFFFIGEPGAKATAEAIIELDGRIDAIKSELNALIAE